MRKRNCFQLKYACSMNKAMKNAATRCIPMYSDTKKGFYACVLTIRWQNTCKNPLKGKEASLVFD